MERIKNLSERVKAAQGEILPDLVIRNTSYLNVFTESFEQADIAIKNGMIVGVGRYRGVREVDGSGKTVVPGFIDGHFHLESSVVSPKQYCKTVVPHGTTAVIADPHEITNVLGVDGFNYILEETKSLPLDVYLMVPSCVPATPFDESGANLSVADVEKMLEAENVLGLAEMMNFPGVLGCSDYVLGIIDASQRVGKIVDGHAPGLKDSSLNAYISAGVRSDHECTNPEEAKEKLSLGQWVMIREGTAGKNLKALLPLFEKPYCDRCMLVTDDKHPGELEEDGHIDHIIRLAIKNGVNPANAYKMGTYNAAVYFGLRRNGAIAPGWYADFVILDDVNSVEINSVYRRGERIDNTVGDIVDSLGDENPYAKKVFDTVHIKEVTPSSFKISKDREKVIGLIPGEILTSDEGYAEGVDISRDICKLSVIERHHATGNMATAFVKGYGLKNGAVATSIAHDSHNIIVVGTNDEDMAFAVNRLKELKGGMVVVSEANVIDELSLPIAGLMCDLDALAAERKLKSMKDAAHSLGVNYDIDPFMTLSFTSLAVIPTLRLTTKGVVDVNKFELLN